MDSVPPVNVVGSLEASSWDKMMIVNISVVLFIFVVTLFYLRFLWEKVATLTAGVMVVVMYWYLYQAALTQASLIVHINASTYKG